MSSDPRHEALDGASAFDPSGLGRPQSGARAVAEQIEQRLIRALQEHLDRLLPPGTELGKIRPPHGWRMIRNLAGFARRLDRLAAHYDPLVRDHGAGSVLANLWETWNVTETGRSLEQVHGQIKRLDEYLAETLRLVHQLFEKPNPDDPSGAKVVPAERHAEFKLLLDIVNQLFAIRRNSLIGEINEIESEFCDHWFAAGAETWTRLEEKWQEWADD